MAPGVKYPNPYAYAYSIGMTVWLWVLAYTLLYGQTLLGLSPLCFDRLSWGRSGMGYGVVHSSSSSSSSLKQRLLLMLIAVCVVLVRPPSLAEVLEGALAIVVYHKVSAAARVVLDPSREPAVFALPPHTDP